MNVKKGYQIKEKVQPKAVTIALSDTIVVTRKLK